MRRSTSIKLTLLPLLAATAIARADPPGTTPPLPPDTVTPDSYEFAPPGADRSFRPPSMVEPEPVVSCTQDPDQPDCPGHGHGAFYTVMRGGFGHYFWGGGG